MALPTDILDRLLKFVVPLYADKDTMHDLTHIRRVHRKAIELADGIECDRQALGIAVYLHGIVYSHETRIRTFLTQNGLEKDEAEKLIGIAWESQKDSSPESNEGKVLHDAHLLEGDDNFIITKVLVAGSARGQSLEESIRYFQNNLLGRHQCVFPLNQLEYERRERIAREFMEKLYLAVTV
ncbi:MAG: hypothetical protein GY866_32995 [Proteobacteria bacterium]|nr:hypothetical protein [Pseudomonadota bacterium]